MSTIMTIGEEVLLEALRKFGADTTAHSSRTLISHLTGTQHLLKKWGNNQDVCLAGLFHSIYGTVYFGTTSVDPSQIDQ